MGTGEAVGDETLALLQRAGLAQWKELSPSGRGLFKKAWVEKKESEALALLGKALRILLPIQVIEQELLGYGPVPEEGALELLRLHRAVPPDVDLERARRAFIWLSKVKALTYSRKHKTVRSVAPAPEAARAGEDARLAAMISPQTPFSNIARLRRILRTLSGTVTWADPHFSSRALEELAEEIDSAVVAGLRIISGDSGTVLTAKSKNDYERFRTEMSNKGIAAEWRVDAARDWHDRWLADDERCYNMPPINTLFKGDYSEILAGTASPPIEDWWARSHPR